jgi:ribosomal protein L40E
MSDEPIKYCTGCGAEYAPEAVECVDCGGKLAWRTKGGGNALQLDEADATFLIRVDSAGYLERVAGELGKEGIRSAVGLVPQDPKSCRGGVVYGLFVTDDDAARAQEIDRAYWLRHAPEQAASFKYEEQELKGICPACSTTLPENATECPECGLVVGEEEEEVTCPDCDAVVGDEVSRCPNCGAEFE